MNRRHDNGEEDEKAGLFSSVSVSASVSVPVPVSARATKAMRCDATDSSKLFLRAEQTKRTKYTLEMYWTTVGAYIVHTYTSVTNVYVDSTCLLSSGVWKLRVRV